jgi:hypothetical protein
MNTKVIEKCLRDAGYKVCPDGEGLYRPDGQLLTTSVTLISLAGNTVVVNYIKCNANTLRWANDVYSKSTNNQQGDSTMGKERLTPLQCVQAWYIARDTVLVNGGSYTPFEKEELLHTILRDHGYDPKEELRKMAETPQLMSSAKTIENGTIVMDMGVNHYLGTAAAIGRFLGRVGAYILIGAIWIFKAAVATVRAIGRGIAIAIGAGAAEFTKCLNERNKQ